MTDVNWNGGDPLPSWNDSAAKSALLALVFRVSDESSTLYVPPTERIATFDNDGTLWCEKPDYVQADFLFRRLRELAEADPEKAERQPYKAALEKDVEWFANYRQHLAELAAGLAEAYAGITPEEFENAALRFFAMARHPLLGVPYRQLIYQPMRELLDFLRIYQFKVFITTGGGRDFVRAISEELYGIPRECVIGSSGQLEYTGGRLVRLAKLTEPIDDGPGKPVHIFDRIGRRPLLAVGNSDGDYEMLELARHGLLLHHDDGEREYAYDTGAERALARARKGDWWLLSMRDDWRIVFGARPRAVTEAEARLGASTHAPSPSGLH